MTRLPYDPTRLDSRPMMYDLHNWRQTPNIRISPQIDRYLDLIAMETANEVSEKANSNALRIFHYNMMSDNEFRNPNFDRLVQFVAEFIEMLVLTRRIGHPEDDLINNINAAVSLHSCKQVLDYPELEDICGRSGDPRMMRALDTNVGKYQQVVRDIAELHEQDTRDIRGSSNFRDKYAGSNTRSAYPGDRGGRTFASQRVMTAREAGGEYAAEARVFRREETGYTDRPIQRQVMSTARTFIERQEPREQGGFKFVPQPLGQERRVSGSERGDYGNDVRVTQYEASPPMPSPYPVTMSEPPAPPVAMTPPPAPPAPPVQENTSIPNGRCNQVIPAFKGIIGSFPILDETTMNINEHSSVYDLNEDQAPKVKEEVIRTLSLAQAVNEDQVDAESIESNVILREAGVAVYGDIQSLVNFASDDAVQEMIEVSGENKGGVRKVVHSFGIVDNAVVGFPQLNDVRKLLTSASSFKETIQGLRRALQIVAGSPVELAMATDIRAVVSIYDSVLTREVNAYFRDVLKLSDQATTSIVEDFDDLLTTIQRTNNNDLINAFLVFLTQLNANLRESLAPDFKVAESVKESNEIDESMLGFCVMPMSYMVTHIPFTASELNFNMDESRAVMSVGEGGFIRAVLDVSKLDIPENLSNSIRLLVTRDRKILRVFKYPGRKDVTILSKYL